MLKATKHLGPILHIGPIFALVLIQILTGAVYASQTDLQGLSFDAAELMALSPDAPTLKNIRPDRQPDQVLLRTKARIEQMLHDSGRVEIWVPMDMDFYPEAQLFQHFGQAGINEQRNHVHRLEKELIVLLGDGLLEFQSYDGFISWVLVLVNSQGYEKLKRHPMYEHVSLPRLFSPLLYRSAPHINVRASESNANPVDYGAFEYGFSGSGFTIAVLDSGFNINHQSLAPANKLRDQACFSHNWYLLPRRYSTCEDGSSEQIGPGSSPEGPGTVCDPGTVFGCGHGTHVASIASGQWSGDLYDSDNGVAPGATIMPIGVFHRSDDQDECVDSQGNNVAPCIKARGANVVRGLNHVYENRGGNKPVVAVNLSLGSKQDQAGSCNASHNQYDQAISQLVSSGIAVVAASGNDGERDRIDHPACLPTTVAVAASWPNSDVISDFSNLSEDLNLFAPGFLINAANAVNETGTTLKSGTSMAAPHVAGAFALLREQDSHSSMHSLWSRLELTGEYIGDPEYGEVRRSRIDVLSAMKSEISVLSALNVSRDQGSHSIPVSTTNSGVRWKAVTDTPWISLPGDSGTGTGNLNITVSQNDTGSPRIGEIYVLGHKVTIYQEGLIPAPFVETKQAASLTQTSGIVRADVNPNGESTTLRFRYGTSSGNLNQTSTHGNVGSGSNLVTGIEQQITGLSCGTNYFFRAEAESAGGISQGSILSFTTSACGGGSINVTASPNPININQMSTITASVPGAGSDVLVTFETGFPAVFNNNQSSYTVPTNSSGQASATFYPDTGVSGTATIIATTTSFGQGTVDLGVLHPAGNVELYLSIYSGTVVQGATQEYRAVVTVFGENGEPVQGWPHVQFTTSRGSPSSGSSQARPSDGTGDWSCTVSSGGTTTVPASIAGSSASATFTAHTGSISATEIEPIRVVPFNENATGLQYTPDGNTLVALPERDRAHLRAFETSEYTQLWSVEGRGRMGGLNLSPDGQLLIYGDRWGYDVRRVGTGVRECRRDNPDQWGVYAAFTSHTGTSHLHTSRTRIFRSSSRCATGSLVSARPREFDSLVNQFDYLYHMAQRPDAGQFATMTNRSELLVMNTLGQLVHRSFGPMTQGYVVNYSEDGSRLVVGGDESLRIVNTGAWTNFHIVPRLLQHRRESAIFFDNDTKLAVSGGSKLEIIDLLTYETIQQANLPTRAFSMAWDPVNEELAVGSQGQGILIFRPLEPPAPNVSTNTAETIDIASASLRASVDPRGSTTFAWFEYGLDQSYGQQTGSVNVGSGTGSQQVSCSIDGLTCETTYHFRAYAENSHGQLVEGGDRSFTTANCPDCNFSLIPQQVVIPPEGGEGTIIVSGHSACAWNVSSSPGWIHLQLPSALQGQGVITFEVDENNSSSAREALIDINGLEFQVFQERYDRIHQDSFVFAPVFTYGRLNDTGVDWCADDDANNLECPVSSHPGQDGDYGRDALARQGLLHKVGAGAAGFDYTKLDANGNDLSATAINWSCVRDNHTGLMWELKVNDPSHLRHQNHTYTWYNPDSNTNGGAPGTQDGGTCAGSTCDIYGFVQAVNAQGLCAANDWRMPRRMELHSLTHLGRALPSIDTDYFPLTPAIGFWSASPYAGSSASALFVHFNHSFDYWSDKSVGKRVRLVQGRQ